MAAGLQTRRPSRWRDARLLAVGLAATGLTLTAGLVGRPAPDPSAQLPPLLLLLAFLATSVWVVEVRVGREAHGISLRDAPLVVALATVPPVALVVALVVGTALPRVVRGERGVKLAFNVGLFLAEAGVAVGVYTVVLGDGSPTGGRGALAAGLAVVAVDLLAAAAINTAILLTTGQRSGRSAQAAASGLVAALCSASLGLLAVVLVTRAPAALPLLGVLVVLLALAYRSHVRLSEGTHRLEVLYDFTRRAGQALADDAVLQTVVEQARDLMTAGAAEVHLAHAAGTERLRLDDDGLRPLDGPDDWWAPALDGEVVHRTATSDGPGPRDAVAAPLHRQGEVCGVLLVVDRVGDVRFTGSDAKLLGALAGTAGVSLANAELLDRLRADAVERERELRRDALTGLPNRRGLLEAVLAAPRPQVLLAMDLVRFEEVNDALGQDVGDEVLGMVGHRLADGLPGAVVARLGADEYAVLAPGSDHAAVSRAVSSALAAPFEVRGLRIPVAARSGTVDVGAQDPAVLLRRAELTVHKAANQGDAWLRYDTGDDARSTSRLALVGDLRSTLDADGLAVHYQPQVDLATGRVRGVEALCRWRHPERGMVPPDVFVPLAEQVGLVDRLTAVVLRQTLGDLARWRAAGLLEAASINLSARSLALPDLVPSVERALCEAGVPATALTLELTETAVLHDPDRAAGVLGELAALGIALSLDDFGTGYSSLAHLRRLPLREVKVDKSFVMRMREDAADAAVVRATIALAHDLGMHVVAEGVEDAATLEHLTDLGCDVAQGYYLARPADALATRSWLQGRTHVPSARTAPATGLPTR